MAVEEEQQIIVFTEKGIYADGHINWTELSEDESDVILRGMEIQDNVPTSMVFDFLFKVSSAKRLSL